MKIFWYIKYFIAYMIHRCKNTIKVAPPNPDKKWYEEWWGALWTLALIDKPGAVKRFQQWDKELDKDK